MKILPYAAMIVTAMTANLAHAENYTATLSQDNKKVFMHLNNKGDTLTVTYDLTRHPIYRQHEWFSYSLFCYAHGKSTIEYTTQNKKTNAKLPFLASTNEYGQEGIGKTIDNYGVFTIRNSSEFYSGSQIECALYPKFGE